VTPEGRATRERLIAARRENLSEMLAGFSPERHAELAAFINVVAHQVTDEV
jgi:DNA-binding MarR family transcriptional regulator